MRAWLRLLRRVPVTLVVHFSFLNCSDSMAERVLTEIEITGHRVPDSGSTGLGILDNLPFVFFILNPANTSLLVQGGPGA